MQRAMGGRMGGASGMRPNVLRLRMRKAMKKRLGLRNFQRFGAERNKSARTLMRKRMGQVRDAGKSFAQKQLAKRTTSMRRMMTDRKFSVRKMQSLQRRNRAQSNQRDADRRRNMRSHASEQRRRTAARGVLSSAMSHSLAR